MNFFKCQQHHYLFQGLLQEELCHTALKKCSSYIINSMKPHQQQQMNHMAKNNRQPKNMIKTPSLRREIQDSKIYRDFVKQVFEEQNEDENVL